MNKRIMIAVVAALVLALASFSYARYVSGFKVIEVSGQQVTIQKGEEKPVVVPVTDGGFKVGDEVKFDADKQHLKESKVKKPLDGC